MIGVVACTLTPPHGIGYQGKIPWHLPHDLRHFRDLTMGGLLLCGPATYASMPPLPGRTVRVVTSEDDPRDQPSDAFVIGGAAVYHAYQPLIDTWYVTYVAYDGPCDRWWPGTGPGDWHSYPINGFVTRIDRWE